MRLEGGIGAGRCGWVGHIDKSGVLALVWVLGLYLADDDMRWMG
jgi:hypothetical protein